MTPLWALSLTVAIALLQGTHSLSPKHQEMRGSQFAVDASSTTSVSDVQQSLSGTDCHASIVHDLSISCVGRADGGSRERMRSDLAISLTLCSLQSANQRIPKECQGWSAVEPTAWWGGRGADRTDPGNCLAALHRSPQDWTTYNGYLGSSTQLCHAFTQEREAELARELYANATQEKVAILRHLQNRELHLEERGAHVQQLWESGLRAMEDRHEAVEATLMSGLAEHAGIIAHLKQVVQLIESSQTSIRDQIPREIHDLAETASDGLKSAMAVLPRVIQAEIKDFIIHGLTDEVGFAWFATDTEHSPLFLAVQRSLEETLSAVSNRHLSFIGEQSMPFLTSLEESATRVRRQFELASRVGDELQASLNSLTGAVHHLLDHSEDLSIAQEAMLVHFQNLGHLSNVVSEGLGNSLTSFNETLKTLYLPTRSKFGLFTGVDWIISRLPVGLWPTSATAWSSAPTSWVIFHGAKLVWLGFSSTLSYLVSLWCLVNMRFFKRLQALIKAGAGRVRAWAPRRFYSPVPSPVQGLARVNIEERSPSTLKHKASQDRRRAFSEAP